MKGNPKFLHDCTKCIFLGHFEKHDLYYCPDDKTLTARFDHDQMDCRTILAGATSDPILGEAFRRAKKRDLLFQVRDQDLFGMNLRFSDDDW